MMYRPVFNITTCMSVLPLEGVALILLAALAPSIYNSLTWARQWSNLSEGQPNPGFLEEDPHNRGKPLPVTNQEELKDFLRTYMTPPHIAFQFRDGADNIPGMVKLSSPNPQARNDFVSRIAHFFGTEERQFSEIADFCRLWETRYDGAYGEHSGVLHDSRDIDYLYIAAKNGMGAIDPTMRAILLGQSPNPTDRAKIIQNVTGTFISLYLDSQMVINPDFIRRVIQVIDQRGLKIVDPTSQTEARSFGSFLDGFGNTQNIGSIVTNGQNGRPGLNLNSVWNNW